MICARPSPQDLDGLDQVMLVISDAAGERGKVLQLLEHITADPQKYLLVAEDKDTAPSAAACSAWCLRTSATVAAHFAGGERCRPGELPGQGVGRKMFQEIERWAKEEWDCHYEILASGLNRTGAHKFYHALGFEEVKGFKKYL